MQGLNGGKLWLKKKPWGDTAQTDNKNPIKPDRSNMAMQNVLLYLVGQGFTTFTQPSLTQ